MPQHRFARRPAGCARDRNAADHQREHCIRLGIVWSNGRKRTAVAGDRLAPGRLGSALEIAATSLDPPWTLAVLDPTQHTFLSELEMLGRWILAMASS